MSMHRIAAALVLIGLSGCGGECPPDGCGASGFHTVIPDNPSPAGIWIGSDVQANLPVTAMIGEDQVAYMIRSDDTVFVGAVTNSVNSQLWAYAPFGSPWTDGSSFGSGTLAAVVELRKSITAQYHYTTTDGTSLTSGLSLNYDAPVYESGSSLSEIAGVYKDVTTGVIFSVNSDGTVFAQDPANGCVLNGRISLIDTGRNLYQVTESYGNCTGAFAVLNGISLKGRAMLDASTGRAQLLVCVIDDPATVRVALIHRLSL